MTTANDHVDRLERDLLSLRDVVDSLTVRLAVTETLHQSVERSITDIKGSINAMGASFEKSLGEVKENIKWGVRIVIGAVLLAVVGFVLKGGLELVHTAG